MSKELSHIDKSGQPAMVDVSGKDVTSRVALAESIVRLNAEILKELENGDIKTKKGPVFQTAIIAGTMAAKKTSELIPFCHPLEIDNCKIAINIAQDHAINITCEVKTTGKTGVEMEALTGASVAALTVYDMCKAMSHDINIQQTRLISKTGGKSDFNRNNAQ